MARPYAGILAALAFATVLCRGIALGGSLESSLQLAAVCLLLFAAIGYVAGTIAEQTIREAVIRRFENELQAETESKESQDKPGQPEK